jgi:hypothetical protein
MARRRVCVERWRRLLVILRPVSKSETYLTGTFPDSRTPLEPGTVAECLGVRASSLFDVNFGSGVVSSGVRRLPVNYRVV